MEKSTQTRIESLNSKDIELLLFSLIHNPLTKSPYFKSRLKVLVGRLLKELRFRSAIDRNSIFQFEPSYCGLSEAELGKLLKFLYALFNEKQVSLLLKNSPEMTEALTPRRVCFKGGCVILVLSSDEGTKDLEIHTDRLEAISISSAHEQTTLGKGSPWKT